MEAFKCYKKAGEFGNARALNNLGLMIESGFDGVAPDPERACSYYKQAHQNGDVDATINLAFYYLNKSEQENRELIAKALLKIAYSKGNKDALSYLLEQGLIGSQDEIQAEIVKEDENGVNAELQALVQIDAVPHEKRK